MCGGGIAEGPRVRCLASYRGSAQTCQTTRAAFSYRLMVPAFLGQSGMKCSELAIN